MNYFLYGLLVVFVLWMLYRMFAPVRGLRELTPQQFGAELKEGKNKLVDVRETHEFKQGHIAGAVNIPLSQLSGRLNEIQGDQPVYLYCKSGMRSKQAAKQLSQSGHSQIAHLRGGIMSWSGPIKK